MMLTKKKTVVTKMGDELGVVVHIINPEKQETEVEFSVNSRSASSIQPKCCKLVYLIHSLCSIYSLRPFCSSKEPPHRLMQKCVQSTVHD